MRVPNRWLHTLLLIITIIPAVLMASVLLFWGANSLLNPFVPQELLAWNATLSRLDPFGAETGSREDRRRPQGSSG